MRKWLIYKGSFNCYVTLFTVFGLCQPYLQCHYKAAEPVGIPTYYYKSTYSKIQKIPKIKKNPKNPKKSKKSQKSKKIQKIPKNTKNQKNPKNHKQIPKIKKNHKNQLKHKNTQTGLLFFNENSKFKRNSKLKP